MLTLRPFAHSGSGLDLTKWDKVVQYEVQGLPDGEKAWIAEMNHRWQILRATNDVHDNWTGEYGSPEEALKALAQRDPVVFSSAVEILLDKLLSSRQSVAPAH